MSRKAQKTGILCVCGDHSSPPTLKLCVFLRSLWITHSDLSVTLSWTHRHIYQEQWTQRTEAVLGIMQWGGADLGTMPYMMWNNILIYYQRHFHRGDEQKWHCRRTTAVSKRCCCYVFCPNTVIHAVTVPQGSRVPTACSLQSPTFFWFVLASFFFFLNRQLRFLYTLPPDIKLLYCISLHQK